MKSFFFVLAQLTLVTIVYAFAYRAGYRAAQSKAVSVVRKFADPVTCLLDQLSESIDEAAEVDNDDRTPHVEGSTHPVGDNPSPDGLKEKTKIDL